MKVDKEKCIWCGSCTVFCPTGAIRQGDGCYEVHTDECVECGACERQCPVSAISEYAQSSIKVVQYKYCPLQT